MCIHTESIYTTSLADLTQRVWWLSDLRGDKTLRFAAESNELREVTTGGRHRRVYENVHNDGDIGAIVMVDSGL